MYGQAYASAQRCGHGLGAAQAHLGLESGIGHRGKFAEAPSMTNQYLMTYNELGSREEVANANYMAGFPSSYMDRNQEARSGAAALHRLAEGCHRILQQARDIAAGARFARYRAAYGRERG